MTTPYPYTEKQLDTLDPRKFIIIKKARVHNLKELSVAIPRNNFIVITGLSGSGKSSLAFDTLFKEGQRMYVESLSAYARQFLGRMEKPDVEYIRGVCPAIAIEQKVSTHNPRSTVGTITEIYDYLKLLFARIGKTYSPKSNQEVKKDTIDEVLEALFDYEDNTKIMISCPIKKHAQRTTKEELELLMSKGFARIMIDGKAVYIEEAIETPNELGKDFDIELLIDRVVVRSGDKALNARLSDSIETAFFEGEGICNAHIEGRKKRSFSDRFELDGLSFVEPSIHLFNFNSPYGVCRNCEGFGKVLSLDEGLVIPDKALSIAEGAIAPWRGQIGQKWLMPLRTVGTGITFPIHRAYEALTQHEKDMLWHGYKSFKGIAAFFEYLSAKTYKIQYRVLLSRYRRRATCRECMGTRLRKDVGYIKINNKSIIDLLFMPLEEVTAFFDTIELNEYEQKIADKVIKEIRERTNCINKLGLRYLTLNRLTSTLSGGELQRLRLSTALGSSLVGSMYIMDEPTIGLHPKDIGRVTEALKSLRDEGNTVIIVEHEEEVMKAADQIIDIGPEAGLQGGNLVFQGTLEELRKHHSHTSNYLSGRENIPIPTKRRSRQRMITLSGAKENNLKNITIEIPLHAFTAITGVSGSGKSTLIKHTLIPAIQQVIGSGTIQPGKYESIKGVENNIARIEFIDQNPIGKSSRSNPISYIKAYDNIRELFAGLPLSRHRAYKPAHFSFNVDGGRCEACQGEGEIKIEMQFVANVCLPCDSCNGSRFKKEILEITYQGKNITDVLDMTVENALVFFKDNKAIHDRITPLLDVGLGYIKLGQPSNSLSGGEAQRVKLASFLGKKSANKNEPILFVFDEPTTGLHFHDIHKLMCALNALIEEGHSVVVIEHNIEVIKCADWIIDLGPEGGEKNGGHLLFMGTPEEMTKTKKSYTAPFLQKKLNALS